MAFRNFDDAALSRRSLLRGSALLAAGATLSGLPLGQVALANVPQSNDWSAIRAMINEYVGSGKVANMLVALGEASHDPYAIARGELGLGSSVTANMDSLYRIYSMTKPITGMATMMLIDEGKIGLDQPVAEILPAFAEMRVLVDPEGSLDNTVPANQPITIRHVLTHTAGLGYDITAKGPLLKAYQANGITSGQLSRFPIPGIPNVKSAPGLAAWADRLATMPLIAQPATKWSYSAGMDLLGRIIEVASGQSFDTFLQERLFGPCGMTSTWFQVPESEKTRLTDNLGIVMGATIPFDPAGMSIFLDRPPILWGGSGLVSSPRDYDRFLRMLLGYGKLEGKRVMGELAVRVGTSNLLPKTVSTEGSWVSGQGMGAAGRVTSNTFGWGGAAGTLAAVDYKNELRMGLFTQYMPADALPVRDRFIAAMLEDLGEAGRDVIIG
ncbi:serine hydrolase domain-containing protein [Altererythrobacter sp. GH1-8]|uniref:serine hydrolase domain-containing protein n=1 Tax=Altererythrobacter sp. GH1-8 TaxID=3349333 RepID=UPI00374D18D9